MTQKYDEPRKVRVTVSLDIDLVEIIENLRGHKKSRSAWINDAIEYTLLHDNIPRTNEEFDKSLQEHLKNLRIMNNSRCGKNREDHHKEA